MVEIVFSTIVTINRAGTAVLMVEQNAKQALAISHRGFVLELGRNRFEGTGRALLDEPGRAGPLPGRLSSHTALGARWRLFRDRQPPATGRCPGSR